MLKEIEENEYFSLFSSTQNPFISKDFYLLNKHKVENVIFLILDEPKPSIGIAVGVSENKIVSPYSAPFGGIHFSHSNIYIEKIEEFAQALKEYFTEKNYNFFKCIFPPSIYGSSFNHKMINSMIRKGFNLETPELTNYIDLSKFNNRFSHKASREYYNQALRKNLTFTQVFEDESKSFIIDLIRENRERSDRTLKMNLLDFQKMEEIWEVNYFTVNDAEKQIVAGAIFYTFPDQKLVFTAIWGDSLEGRNVRAMDFLSFKSWSHYKENGFKYVDLGISTEDDGVPNQGLLRFKETHEAETELRHILTLKL